MKPASDALKGLLASRQFMVADLFLFSLNGGGQLNYCSGEQDIVWNNVNWSSGGLTGPYFVRKGANSQCHWKIGVAVDSLTFDVLPAASTIFGTPFLSAVRNGVFDGAELTLYRAFMPTYGNVSAGTVIMFAGRVAQITAGGSAVTFTINSHLELLNQNLPRNVYQAGCLNSLFDSGCGLNQALYAVNGTVVSAASASQITASFSAANGYFDQGVMVLTSGVDSGLSRTVKNFSGNIINLIAPFPSSPVAGDSFTVYAGCDKSQGTCSGKFGNLARFRGFPYVPENETAV